MYKYYVQQKAYRMFAHNIPEQQSWKGVIQKKIKFIRKKKKIDLIDYTILIIYDIILIMCKD